MKGFATSLSIILSSCISWFIPAFDFQPTLAFIAGSTLVILATILYSSPQSAAIKPSKEPEEDDRGGSRDSYAIRGGRTPIHRLHAV